MNSFTHALRQALPAQKSFVRHASSSRRHTKLLRLHPHPSMKLTAVSPKVDHIIFNPPASAPTPLITPTMFLPQSDMRRTLMATLKPAAAESKPLPPPLKPITQKSYHLTPADVKRMRKLRKEDPVKWHRHALAKEFNCSRLFVGISCQATPERVEQMKARFEKIKGKWGPKRTIARQDRQRRKAGWGGADGL